MTDGRMEGKLMRPFFRKNHLINEGSHGAGLSDRS